MQKIQLKIENHDLNAQQTTYFSPTYSTLPEEKNS